MLTKIWRDIDNNKLAAVYAIIGEEAYFIDETVRKIQTSLSQQDETETMIFDLNEVPVDEALNEADTIPFFSERKLVLVKNATIFKATDKAKGKEKIVHDVERVARFLADPPPFTVTVFIAPYEKLDERKKITKLLKQHATIIEAKTPGERDLSVWIQAQVGNYSKSITDEAVALLTVMVGANMLQLQMEIAKLCLYLGDDHEITADLVNDLVAKTLEQDAFKMLNAYFAGDAAQALEVYHDLLQQKQEPIMLVGLLASTIRTMNSAFYLQKKGYHQQQIAKQLKVHPYRVKLLLEQRERPQEQRLLQALYDLANVDYALKTTSGNRDRFLELFLLKTL